MIGVAEISIYSILKEVKAIDEFLNKEKEI